MIEFFLQELKMKLQQENERLMDMVTDHEKKIEFISDEDFAFQRGYIAGLEEVINDLSRRLKV